MAGSVSGPAPKPNALKVLEGNPGKRPIGTDPAFTKGAPLPPRGLSGEALAEWGRVVPELEKAGLLTRVDRAALIAYCEAWGMYTDAMASVHEYGILTTGRDGGKVKNPAVQIARDSIDTLIKLGSRFGWTPSDRVRLSVPSGNEDDGPEKAALSLLS